MCDKALAVVLAVVALVYNWVAPGVDIPPELIFTNVFVYIAGSQVGFQRGKNGSAGNTGH